VNTESFDREPRYVISIAARMLDTNTYTLRYYERVGVIEPRRSEGKQRLYSDYDIALLKRVKSMVDDMGINLPGVEVVLRMMQHVDELQRSLDEAHKEIEQLRGGNEE
jgi:MerR family transcriptional regulator, heat shock protein HspR